MDRRFPMAVVAFFIAANAGLVAADRGMVVIDPPHMIFTESSQQAIIAWDGSEEILLLSTDVSSSGSARVLEVLPVPNNVTEVVEGSLESFTNLERLLAEKIPTPRDTHQLAEKNGVEIQFHEQIGPHEVMIVKVNDADYFKYWVLGFAFSRNFTYTEISVEFRKAVTDYIDRGINYFIFDVITTDEETKTVNPLAYRFKSDYLYYPMKITSVSNTSDYFSRLKLFLLTDLGQADTSFIEAVGLSPGDGFANPISLSSTELGKVSEPFQSMFPDGAYAMTVDFYGPYSTLKEDLVLKPSAFHEEAPFSIPPGTVPGASAKPNPILALAIIGTLLLALVFVRPR